MATIKSYTDLEQSKKLVEILPLESADMIYTMVNGYHTPFIRIETIKEMYEDDVLCWSLTALLDVLPTLDGRNAILCKDIRYDEWHICYHSTATLSVIDTERYDNPVDACVAMIERLHELKML